MQQLHRGYLMHVTSVLTRQHMQPLAALILRWRCARFQSVIRHLFTLVSTYLSRLVRLLDCSIGKMLRLGLFPSPEKSVVVSRLWFSDISFNWSSLAVAVRHVAGDGRPTTFGCLVGRFDRGVSSAAVFFCISVQYMSSCRVV